jgi:hypothetical protein
VDIVTVEEPEELLFIMASLLDSGHCIADKVEDDLTVETVGRDVSLGLGMNQSLELALNRGPVIAGSATQLLSGISLYSQVSYLP